MHTTVSKWLFLAFAKQGAPRYLGLRPKNLATAQLKSATVECFQLFPAPHVLINQGLKENCMFFFSSFHIHYCLCYVLGPVAHLE